MNPLGWLFLTAAMVLVGWSLWALHRVDRMRGRRVEAATDVDDLSWVDSLHSLQAVTR